MKKTLLSLLFLNCVTGLLLGQHTFFRTFDAGLHHNDRGWSLAADSSGYIVATIAGCISVNGYCMGLGRFDLSGNLQWAALYEGFRNAPNCILTTKDGNFVVAGDTQLPDGDTTIFVMKIDQQGDSLWTKYYPSPSSNYARSINELPNGDLIIEGDGRPPNSLPRPEKTVIKTDALGNLKWHKDYPDTFRLSQFGELTVLKTGELLMCYDTWTWTQGYSRCAVTKLDSSGNVLWTKKYFKDPRTTRLRIRELPNNRYALIGAIDSFIPQSGSVILALIVTDTSGNNLSEKHLYRGHTLSFLSNIAQSSDGNFIGGGGHFWNELESAWAIKFTPTGEVLWERTFSWKSQDLPFWFEDVKPTAWGGIALSGTAVDLLPNGLPSDADAMLLVLDSDGCLYPSSGCSGNIQYVSPATDLPPDNHVFGLLPNPANNLLTVQCSLPGSATLTVFDVLGQVMYAEILPSQAEEVQISVVQWPDGLYFASITSAHFSSLTKTFIVQK